MVWAAINATIARPHRPIRQPDSGRTDTPRMMGQRLPFRSGSRRWGWQEVGYRPLPPRHGQTQRRVL